MKLSADTITVLKNFATINTNILFREGNMLRTISAGKGVFAAAKVAESFPREFAIYDLNSLLSLLTLMDDQDIEFGEKSLTISKDGGSFEYFYSSPSIIVAAPDKKIEFDEYYTFALTAADVNMITKAACIVGAANVSFVTENGKVIMVVGDRKDASSNKYSKVVGAFSEELDCHISISNFSIIADNYTVTLAQKKLMHMKAETKNVEYFIAMEPDSKL